MQLQLQPARLAHSPAATRHPPDPPIRPANPPIRIKLETSGFYYLACTSHCFLSSTHKGRFLLFCSLLFSYTVLFLPLLPSYSMKHRVYIWYYYYINIILLLLYIVSYLFALLSPTSASDYDPDFESLPLSLLLFCSRILLL